MPTVEEFTSEKFRKHYTRLVNDPDFDRLQLGLSEPNIFEILKITHAEIRHSNFLAWLLDPRGSHNWGDKVLKRILRDLLAHKQVQHLTEFDVENLNYTEVEVRREWRNIDLLVILPTVVLAIENKVRSKDHSKQLSNYKEIVESTFPEKEDHKMERVFVYLTPFGEAPTEDVSGYINYSYIRIIEILESIKDVFHESTSPIVLRYIDDYIKTVKRTLMSNDDLSNLARKVYLNHKEVLDFLSDFKPDYTETIKKPLYELIEESGWVKGSENKSYKRFTTKEIAEFMPKAPLPNGWPEKEAFLFEFQLSQKRLVFKTVIAPGTGKVVDILTEILENLPGGKKVKAQSWRANFSIGTSLDMEKIMGMTDEQLKGFLSLKWKEYSEIVKKVNDALVMNKQRIIEAAGNE